jgi:hypothetical protein
VRPWNLPSIAGRDLWPCRFLNADVSSDLDCVRGYPRLRPVRRHPLLHNSLSMWRPYSQVWHPKNSQQLNWRTSIVDLMKLLDLDSSLNARKELATELHYTGDKNDSASMNIWLHKQVMQKLAENGGKVPDNLKS